MRYLTHLLILVGLLAVIQPGIAQESNTFLTIQNKQLRVKQDLTRGGAISHLFRGKGERSFVNIADEGRYIQQSYYAGKSIDRKAEGQGKSWSPWSWNPIQVGDYARNRATILEAKGNRKSTYVKCIPMLWDMNNMPAEAVMEQWTTLHKNVLHVRCKLTCQRTDTIYGDVSENSQEIPAVYPISALNHLYYYQGDKPFTGESADSTDVQEIRFDIPDHFWGRYPKVMEKWMAFIGDDGWGMGVYSPSATSFLAGRFKPSRSGEATDSGTSYIAPLRNQKVNKDSVIEYEYFLVMGTVEEIQRTIYKLSAKYGF